MKSPQPNSEAGLRNTAGSELQGVFKTAHETPAGRVGVTARLSGSENASHVFRENASGVVSFVEGRPGSRQEAFSTFQQL